MLLTYFVVSLICVCPPAYVSFASQRDWCNLGLGCGWFAWLQGVSTTPSLYRRVRVALCAVLLPSLLLTGLPYGSASIIEHENKQRQQERGTPMGTTS